LNRRLPLWTDQEKLITGHDISNVLEIPPARVQAIVDFLDYVGYVYKLKGPDLGFLFQWVEISAMGKREIQVARDRNS